MGTDNEKVALFAFNGEPMCFVHALLNAFDLRDKGHDVKLIIEGSATKLIKDLSDPQTPFAPLYTRARDEGLIDCVCRACSTKMGTIREAENQSLPLCDEMSGHPSMGRYMAEGYTIIAL
ncbi:MAG TPA: cytoplasmic protein [Methanomicrobia archaeon]|nr:cytoplasmic protein [Methanomicrobia archaeon]